MIAFDCPFNLAEDNTENCDMFFYLDPKDDRSSKKVKSKFQDKV